MDFELYARAAEYIKAHTDGAETAVVLGSGLGSLAQRLKNAVKIPYGQIPHFPKSTAPSHEGALYFGTLADKRIICMSGRFHYYEGYSMEETVFYVRTLRLAGIKKLILTNAAGGINKEFKPGDLMLISDHINFCGLTPLRGENNDKFGVRFPDMTNAYSEKLRRHAKNAAARLNIDLKEGVYAYMPGPSYETPAEIHALGVLSADAVGMSTVPECVCAVHCGMETAAISCITNMASGITGMQLSEQEVIDTAAKCYEKFSLLIEELIRELR